MGFAEGLEADAFSVRLFASDGGRRGVLLVLQIVVALWRTCRRAERADRQCDERASVRATKRIARITFSSPRRPRRRRRLRRAGRPRAAQTWDEEFGAMRDRIKKNARNCSPTNSRSASGPGFLLHRQAERQVFLFAPHQAPGIAAAGKIRGLCARFRPYLRCRAEREKISIMSPNASPR